VLLDALPAERTRYVCNSLFPCARHFCSAKVLRAYELDKRSTIEVLRFPQQPFRELVPEFSPVAGAIRSFVAYYYLDAKGILSDSIAFDSTQRRFNCLIADLIVIPNNFSACNPLSRTFFRSLKYRGALTAPGGHSVPVLDCYTRGSCTAQPLQPTFLSYFFNCIRPSHNCNLSERPSTLRIRHAAPRQCRTSRVPRALTACLGDALNHPILC